MCLSFVKGPVGGSRHCRNMNPLSDCVSTRKKWETLSSVSWVLSILIIGIAIAIYIKRKRALEQVRADYSNLRRYVLTDGEQAARLNQHVLWLEDQINSLEGGLRATQDRERQLAEYIRMHDMEIGREQGEDGGRDASMFVVGPEEGSDGDDGPYEQEKTESYMEDAHHKARLSTAFGEPSWLSEPDWNPNPHPYGGTHGHHETFPTPGTEPAPAHLPRFRPPRFKNPHNCGFTHKASKSPSRRRISPGVESELYASVRSMVEAEEAKSSMVKQGPSGEVAGYSSRSGSIEDGFVEIVDNPSPVSPGSSSLSGADAHAQKEGEKTGWTPGEWEMLEIETAQGSSGKDGKKAASGRFCPANNKDISDDPHEAPPLTTG
ncbi:hypothetical protein DL546_005913 [Coniochaeta pulveracea]|uniref:Uncharacterized protein n=1 Tax=Coniochaeta pulveracea TaxID=177199 RepID=A0A420Y465_9PEZI|nr:hypothetical protein DL546_005913 [Coniochaeta pulveracea]